MPLLVVVLLAVFVCVGDVECVTEGESVPVLDTVFETDGVLETV